MMKRLLKQKEGLWPVTNRTVALLLWMQPSKEKLPVRAEVQAAETLSMIEHVQAKQAAKADRAVAEANRKTYHYSYSIKGAY